MVNVIFPFKSTWVDYPDNESLAVLVYFMGCDRNCLGCHNSNFMDRNYDVGTSAFDCFPFYVQIQNACEKYKTDKIVFEGGDPLFSKNLYYTKQMLISNTLLDKFKICIYTGYDIEYVKEKQITDFEYIKCGSYVDELKQKPEKTNEYIKFASNNQELYNNEYEKISENGIYYF